MRHNHWGIWDFKGFTDISNHKLLKYIISMIGMINVFTTHMNKRPKSKLKYLISFKQVLNLNLFTAQTFHQHLISNLYQRL